MVGDIPKVPCVSDEWEVDEALRRSLESLPLRLGSPWRFCSDVGPCRTTSIAKRTRSENSRRRSSTRWLTRRGGEVRSSSESSHWSLFTEGSGKVNFGKSTILHKTVSLGKRSALFRLMYLRGDHYIARVTLSQV